MGPGRQRWSAIGVTRCRGPGRGARAGGGVQEERGSTRLRSACRAVCSCPRVRIALRWEARQAPWRPPWPLSSLPAGTNPVSRWGHSIAPCSSLPRAFAHAVLSVPGASTLLAHWTLLPLSCCAAPSLRPLLLPARPPNLPNCPPKLPACPYLDNSPRTPCSVLVPAVSSVMAWATPCSRGTAGTTTVSVDSDDSEAERRRVSRGGREGLAPEPGSQPVPCVKGSRREWGALGRHGVRHLGLCPPDSSGSWGLWGGGCSVGAGAVGW